MAAVLIGGTALLSHAQTFTKLADFDGKNGQSPLNHDGSSLVQGPDGNFYGTTRDGGAYTNGTVFRMTPDGAITALYSFTGQVDGGRPTNGLTLGVDGNFYGATETSIF